MDFQHQLEQTDAYLRDFSKLLRNYYEYLMNAGFTKEQAYELVKEYHGKCFDERG